MSTSAKEQGSVWKNNTSSNTNNPADSNKTTATNNEPSSPRAKVRKRKRKTDTSAASSSSSSSSSDEDDDSNTRKKPSEGWRVKLYRLNPDGSWDDCGTGRIVCHYNQGKDGKSPNNKMDDQVYRELGDPTLCMRAETTGRVLLRTRILLRDAYQRQGDNIITWCEPYFQDEDDEEEKPPQGQPPPGVDLALSFQDNAGCLDIWRQITHVQSHAAEWFRKERQQDSSSSSSSVTDMAQAVAAAHHATLQRQQQHAMWVNVASEAAAQHYDGILRGDEEEGLETNAEAVAVSMAAAAAAAYGNDQVQPSLPNPPTLQNLEEIADVIAAAQQLQQRESLALYMSRNDCSYLKALLSLFPSAEARGDYGALATLAACIKTILLMNDPSTIDLIITETPIYEQVCSALEYDPDLRDKANHRWFLRERRKFRTVVLMEDEDLIATIHRCFRVTYLRDTLLRPTMDESSLSTLSSLQTFTHADVVKGVTQGGNDSYLVKVIRMLGRDLPAICDIEWRALEDPSSVVTEETPQKEDTSTSTSWKQHLAPQDGSLASRLIRRKGALSFFRELFNMVRVSLQQSDKDDFYAAICNMEVELDDTSVNLLSLMANVLVDPSADVAEKGGVLEIIVAIAMHDPSHIRRHCLDLYEAWKKQEGEKMTCPGRPNANDAKQIIFSCGPNDLLASLLFLMAVETDAGLLLQTTEIMRIILDTDMLGEHGPMEGGGGPPGMQQQQQQQQHPTVEPAVASHSLGSEQNQFLAMFYEHYVQWLAAPFQYTVLHTVKRAPAQVLASPSDSSLMQRMLETFKAGVTPQNSSLLRIVPMCAIRSSFAVELLSFCVRAHLYRMKFFLLRSRVLGSVLRLLKPNKVSRATSGDRCLKLAALRFLRSILSVKDEFYHRHIIQHNLFAPVFEAFRANPVGDNLVSSAIVEMCDFIHNQEIKSLIEYIVTKHLSAPSPSSVLEDRPSLEDVATPYVQTLTILRKTYEDDLKKAQATDENAQSNGGNTSLAGAPRVGMSEKALEDQRKFREADEEESYFDADDDEEETRQTDSDLHRTPRMFSLSEQSLDPPTGEDKKPASKEKGKEASVDKSE